MYTNELYNNGIRVKHFAYETKEVALHRAKLYAKTGYKVYTYKVIEEIIAITKGEEQTLYF